MDEKQKIILVDDNRANLFAGESMLEGYYDIYALPSAMTLFKCLEHVNPDLILLDIEMPDMNGYEAIKIIKSDHRYADIPVIFVTARAEETDELEGLALGAADYVTKPFSAAILLKRIETHLTMQKQKGKLREANERLKDFNENLLKMVTEKTQQVTELQSSVINAIADLVEFRDGVTGNHVSRTQKYMQLMVEQLIRENIYSGEVLSWEDMDSLIISAQLHDVGKIFISDAILNKPAKLTGEEFEIMKTHARKGTEAIMRMERKKDRLAFLRYAETIAETHHEKWDGSGYPRGLTRQEIPLEGRIMAIADVYDALTSVRAYKKPYTSEESSRIIMEGAGTHFDPALVEVFARLSGDFACVARECGDDPLEKFISASP